MFLKNTLRTFYHMIPQSIRIGGGYHSFYREYQQKLCLPYEKRLENQLSELQAIVSYAYTHTKYYRKLFDEYGIDVKKIQDFSDMKAIPFLTKDILKEHMEDMISDCIPRKKLLYVMTGGSTGNPLGFYITKETDLRRLAFTWHSWRPWGYRMGMPCAVLRGAVVKGGWFHYDRGEKYLYLSTYDMVESNMGAYIDKLVEFSPPFLRGYPSALEILARYVLREGISLKGLKLKAIFTSSEVLLEEQRRVIEEAFDCPLGDLYGNCEQVGFIATCQHDNYHEYMEHSYLEYLKEDGSSAKNGEFCEIVGTSFINNAVPFIRYKTEDHALMGEGYQCSCGIQSRMIKYMQGRTGDSLKTKYGNLISITALNSHSDIFEHTVRIQYYQEKEGIVILKIIPRSDYTEEDSKKIYAELGEKFKDQVELHLEFVDSIPLTPRGKYKYLDQRLKL